MFSKAMNALQRQATTEKDRKEIKRIMKKGGNMKVEGLEHLFVKPEHLTLHSALVLDQASVIQVFNLNEYRKATRGFKPLGLNPKENTIPYIKITAKNFFTLPLGIDLANAAPAGGPETLEMAASRAEYHELEQLRLSAGKNALEARTVISFKAKLTAMTEFWVDYLKMREAEMKYRGECAVRRELPSLELLNMLENTRRPKGLDLHGLYSEPILLMLRSLSYVSSLAHVDLSSNELDSKELQTLSNVIRIEKVYLRRAVSLDFSRNQITRLTPEQDALSALMGVAKGPMSLTGVNSLKFWLASVNVSRLVLDYNSLCDAPPRVEESSDEEQDDLDWLKQPSTKASMSHALSAKSLLKKPTMPSMAIAPPTSSKHEVTVSGALKTATSHVGKIFGGKTGKVPAGINRLVSRFRATRAEQREKEEKKDLQKREKRGKKKERREKIEQDWKDPEDDLILERRDKKEKKEKKGEKREKERPAIAKPATSLMNC
eukprot:Selendium_serpulae@DN6382_c1_g1_i14.p1